MVRQAPETSIFIWGDRRSSEADIKAMAGVMAASGVVDSLSIPDHMVNLIPPSLWTPDNAPLAAFVSDPDSLMDAVVLGVLAHAGAPELHLNFCGDPVRKSPADLCQLMWSLASVTQGRVRFQFGPGEAKNLNPYGHKRSQGLARFEDLLKIAKALWEADAPIDYVGNHWELQQAYLGAAKSHRPQIWSMGTGPRQLELATSFCDGMTGSMPNVWTTPEHARTEIEQIKATLIAKQRDPQRFGFGAFCMVICHEDPSIVDQALDNPIIRWLAATVGRLKSPAEFLKDGIEPATPEGWLYFQKLLPYATSAEFAREVVSKSTRRMAEASFLYGNPDEIATQIARYGDAGITAINLMDFAPLVLEPADAAQSLARMIAICASLKALAPQGVSLDNDAATASR